jgi:hypothetical protein
MGRDGRKGGSGKGDTISFTFQDDANLMLGGKREGEYITKYASTSTKLSRVRVIFPSPSPPHFNFWIIYSPMVIIGLRERSKIG